MALWQSNPSNHKKIIKIQTCSALHQVGDFTEYDLIMGTLPECDGLTSDEEDSMDEDEEQVE